jgi:hypothetical protein
MFKASYLYLFFSTILQTHQPTAINAQFGLPNRRGGDGGGAKSFEQLNKMAAERMGGDDNAGGVGLGGLGDLGDIGALMKDLDPESLQELMMEGMKDPQVQEMVRELFYHDY